MSFRMFVDQKTCCTCFFANPISAFGHCFGNFGGDAEKQVADDRRISSSIPNSLKHFLEAVPHFVYKDSRSTVVDKHAVLRDVWPSTGVGIRWAAVPGTLHNVFSANIRCERREAAWQTSQ